MSKGRPGGSSRSFRFGRRELGKYLQKPNWDFKNLVPINKNFYIPHEDVVNRCEDYLKEFITINNIETKGGNIPKPIIHFEEGNFLEYVMQHIKEKEFKLPTAIQAQGIPAILSGRDFIGISKENSGKSIAFILSMIVHIHNQKPLSFGEGPIVLILCPSKAVAQENHSLILEFIRGGPLSSLLICGGEPKTTQIEKLAEGSDIVVATVGRLLEMLEIDAINFSRCSMVILDNAIDLGDLESQLNPIINLTRPDKQLVIFSSKWPTKLLPVLGAHLNDPIQINLLQQHGKQTIQVVTSKMHRMHRFLDFIDKIDPKNDKRILVFAVSARLCSKMRANLLRRGKLLNVVAMKNKLCRPHISEFVQKRVNYLLVKDKYDIFEMLEPCQVDHVINFGYPYSFEVYIKRIECAARICPDAPIFTIFEKLEKADDLIHYLHETDQEIPPPLRALYNGGKASKPGGRNVVLSRNKTPSISISNLPSDINEDFKKEEYIPFEENPSRMAARPKPLLELRGMRKRSHSPADKYKKKMRMEDAKRASRPQENRNRHPRSEERYSPTEAFYEQEYLDHQSPPRRPGIFENEQFSYNNERREPGPSRQQPTSYDDSRQQFNTGRFEAPEDVAFSLRPQISAPTMVDQMDQTYNSHREYIPHEGGSTNLEASRQERFSNRSPIFENNYQRNQGGGVSPPPMGRSLFDERRSRFPFDNEETPQRTIRGEFEMSQNERERPSSFQSADGGRPNEFEMLRGGFPNERERQPQQPSIGGWQNESEIFQPTFGGRQNDFEMHRGGFPNERERPPQQPIIGGRQNEFGRFPDERERSSQILTFGDRQNEREILRDERERPPQRPEFGGHQDEFEMPRGRFPSEREMPTTHLAPFGARQNEFEMLRDERERAPQRPIIGGRQDEIELFGRRERSSERGGPFHPTIGGRQNEFEMLRGGFPGERDMPPQLQSIGGMHNEMGFRQGAREEPLPFSPADGGWQNRRRERRDSRERLERDRPPLGGGGSYFPPQQETPPPATRIMPESSPLFMVDRVGNVDRPPFNEMDYPRRRREATPDRRYFDREEDYRSREGNPDYNDRRREVDRSERPGNSYEGFRGSKERGQRGSRPEQRREAQNNRRDFDEERRKRFPSPESRRGRTAGRRRR